MNRLVLALATGVVALIAITGIVLRSEAQSSRPAGTVVSEPRNEGERVLEASAAAYRMAAGLRDVMNVEVRMPQRPTERFEIEYGFGAGTDSYVRLPGLAATALGERVYLTADEVGNKYLELELSNELETTLDGVFGGSSNLPAPFAMRANRGVDRYVRAMTLGVLEGGRVTGHQLVGETTGDASHEVRIEAPNGTATARFDARTKLLERVDVEAFPPGAPPDAPLTATVKHRPVVQASPNGVVAFDPGDRRSVSSIRDLAPTPIAVGDEAPDFALATLDSDELVSLSSMRGSVVVIDFWATWCGPCRRGLPLLDEFGTWARGSGKPIKVFALDTFERGQSVEAIRDKSAAFWKAQGYATPSLFDPDSAVAREYGVQSIPATFVIDADGAVARIHRGFDPNMVATLKRDVTALLGD